MPDRGREARPTRELTDVIFEFTAVGNSVRVCAVDPETGLEVTIIGPVSASEDALRRTAMAKLRYALDRARRETHPRGGMYA